MKQDRNGVRLKLKMWSLMEKLGLYKGDDMWWIADEDAGIVVELYPMNVSDQIAALGHKQTWIEKI